MGCWDCLLCYEVWSFTLEKSYREGFFVSDVFEGFGEWKGEQIHGLGGGGEPGRARDFSQLRAATDCPAHPNAGRDGSTSCTVAIAERAVHGSELPRPVQPGPRRIPDAEYSVRALTARRPRA